jgi:hypothetical protein
MIILRPNMNIDELIQHLKIYYTNNKEITIAVIVALVVAVLIKPKEIKKILIAVGIIATTGYLLVTLINITKTGINRTSEMGIKTDNIYHERGLDED